MIFALCLDDSYNSSTLASEKSSQAVICVRTVMMQCPLEVSSKVVCRVDKMSFMKCKNGSSSSDPALHLVFLSSMLKLF